MAKQRMAGERMRDHAEGKDKKPPLVKPGSPMTHGGKGGTKGTFTRSASRAGMGVQEYARKVLADPNASGDLKKKANFARNFGGRGK